MKGDALDPSGLIAESYRIDGITAPECRSIFLDWALKLSEKSDTTAHITALLLRHAAHSDHPMTQTLRAGLDSAGPPRRRGGRNARLT